LGESEEDRDRRTALKAISELRLNAELKGKLLGELGSKTKPPSKHLHLHGMSAERLLHLAESGEMPDDEQPFIEASGTGKPS